MPNVTPPAVQSPQPTVVSITVLQQYPPGIWRVQLGYSDGSVVLYGLVADHVQYWIDQGATFVDDTGTFPVSPIGTTNKVTVKSKVVNIAVSDQTIVKSS